MIIFTITDVFITIVCVLCKPSPCLRGGRRESSPCCWRWPSESSRVQKKRKFTLLLKMAIRPWAIPAPIFNKSASPSLGLLAGPCKGKRKILSRANSVIVESGIMKVLLYFDWGIIISIIVAVVSLRSLWGRDGGAGDHKETNLTMEQMKTLIIDKIRFDFLYVSVTLLKGTK